MQNHGETRCHFNEHYSDMKVDKPNETEVLGGNRT